FCARRELYPLNDVTRAVQDINRPEIKMTGVRDPRQKSAELQGVSGATAQRQCFGPLCTVRVALPPRKVGSCITGRRQDHVCFALCADSRVECLSAHGAIQQALENYGMVCHRQCAIVTTKTGCDRLRIEELRIDEVNVMWREVEVCCDEMRRGDNVI